MKMKIKRFYLLVAVMITNIALAQQQSNVVFFEPQKHQLGIGISKFVNAAFPSDSNAFLLEYRYLKSPKIAYRIAADYRVDTGTDDFYEVATKIGIDTSFKNIGKWHFYYGADFWGRYLHYGNRNQHFINLAVNPFLGILYQFSRHFSVSTEPGFFIKYNFSKDNRTFNPENQRNWFESRLAKIGYVQLNFHF